MQRVSELLEQRSKTRLFVGPPNSALARTIRDLVDFMEKVTYDEVLARGYSKGNHEAAERVKEKRSRLMKYWIGRTKGIKPARIAELVSIAKQGGKNPQALFNHLLAVERTES